MTKHVENMSIFCKALHHARMICMHKAHVARYCFMAGLYKQGFTHDLSKFSPTEFAESVRYYTGSDSPIVACKADKGYSIAWQHHKGRNQHHYEYWQDDFDHGGRPLQMPFKFALELVCDYLGAGHAYMGHNFSYQKEYEWWQDKKGKPIAMHPQTILFVENMLKYLAETEDTSALRKHTARKIYERAEREITPVNTTDRGAAEDAEIE